MQIKKEEIVSIVEEVVKRVKEKLKEGEIPVVKKEGIKSSSISGVCSAKQMGSERTESTCGGCGECVTKNVEAVREIVSAGANRVTTSSGISSKLKISSAKDLAILIDHTLLRPDAKEDEIVKLCKEAMEYHFATVCLNPAYVSLASRLLTGSGVKVCTVVGFPLGSMTTEAKAFETRDAIMKGADEIDMVINVGKLKSGDYKHVIEDIQGVVKSSQNKVVKVIIEAAHLTDYEKVIACILAKAGGAHFVKTSTGFGKGGATARDVALMRKVVGEEMGIKAAGGIRDFESALEMIKAGATRIGASASVVIVNPTKKKS